MGPDQYVAICSGIMSIAMFALLLFMLISSSSMFEFHMLVAIVVMFNILELILKLLPNFPTIQKPYYRQFPELKMTALDRKSVV